MWTEAVREDIWIFADDRDKENEEKKEKKVKRKDLGVEAKILNRLHHQGCPRTGTLGTVNVYAIDTCNQDGFLRHALPPGKYLRYAVHIRDSHPAN